MLDIRFRRRSSRKPVAVPWLRTPWGLLRAAPQGAPTLMVAAHPSRDDRPGHAYRRCAPTERRESTTNPFAQVRSPMRLTKRVRDPHAVEILACLEKTLPMRPSWCALGVPARSAGCPGH
jgi:hypothetical protein